MQQGRQNNNVTTGATMVEHNNKKPVATKPPPLPEDFLSMTADEKYLFFKSQMLSTQEKNFISAEVEATYTRRIQRWFDIIELKEPDRVPVSLLTAGYRAEYSNITQADAFYAPEKLAAASLRFHEDFQPDFATPTLTMPGRAFEKLDVKMMNWPGGSRPNALSDHMHFQYVEGEYMQAGEYEQLINNPEGYLLRNWYPRVFGNLSGLHMLPNLFTPIEPGGIGMLLMQLGKGPAREAIDNLLSAADAAHEDSQATMKAYMEMQYRWGAPNIMGGLSKAPFDFIGDTMRGTREVMLDMYRCPEQLLAACDALVPLAVSMGVSAAMATRNPLISMPLHKGADSFMSEHQFEKFYWPSFKKVLEGLIQAGLVPCPFVEGSYNNRLDIIAASDLPRGRTLWMFDQTDMKTAKEKFTGFACVGGNVPASLIATGSAEEVDARCRELIETCAPGGGYFLSTGATIDVAKPENIHALIGSGRKYGVYRNR